jgi:two-component system NtrC family response regulator
MVREGKFREDFYYRLNVVAIRIPPLRERREDIPPLIDAFIQRLAAENGKHVVGVSREAMDTLMKYFWPGNVRELENVMQQSVVLCRQDIITSEDLPPRVHELRSEKGVHQEEGTFTEKVEAYEQSLIIDALKDAGGVQTRAAELLGIGERHLRYKLKKYGMK